MPVAFGDDRLEGITHLLKCGRLPEECATLRTLSGKRSPEDLNEAERDGFLLESWCEGKIQACNQLLLSTYQVLSICAYFPSPAWPDE